MILAIDPGTTHSAWVRINHDCLPVGHRDGVPNEQLVQALKICRQDDLVVIESRAEARNGETVVALVDGGDATLKRFYRNGADVKLVPANSEMEPIERHASEVTIRGVLKGLIRSY